ncbi:MAG: FecR domain-containing protein [Bacteroidetes bacterium]|nr:FecR domain-containing protein [Bacteroidota bacterium]
MINVFKKRWKPNTNKAWQRLSARLLAEGLMGPDMIAWKEKASVRSYIPRWSIAAALTCLLATGMAVWWMKNLHAPDLLCTCNTDNDQFLVENLEDGSTVYLAPNSQLTYPEHFASDQRQLQLEGDAFFEVQPDGSRPFCIETKYASVEVLGTAFHLNSGREKDFVLSVKSGKVRISLAKPKQVFEVGAGEWLSLRSGRWEKESINSGIIPTVGTGTLNFRDKRLEEIIRVVNMLSVSKVAMILADHELEDLRLTLTIKTGNIAETAVLICSALGLTQINQEDKIILSGGQRVESK